VYPLRIRVTDPIVITAFKRVSTNRITRVTPNIAKKIGHKIPRKIKRDGVIIENGVFGITNPAIKLDYKPAYGKRKGYDFIFKTLF